MAAGAGAANHRGAGGLARNHDRQRRSPGGPRPSHVLQRPAGHSVRSGDGHEERHELRSTHVDDGPGCPNRARRALPRPECDRSLCHRECGRIRDRLVLRPGRFREFVPGSERALRLHVSRRPGVPNLDAHRNPGGQPERDRSSRRRAPHVPEFFRRRQRARDSRRSVEIGHPAAVLIEDVIICEATDTLESAVRTMKDRGCGCVPVVDDRSRVVGLVTDRDAV
ncbi:MAG: CBS domain-containing protein, partial [Vicinamibacteria bacterium]|nr:CBS domain-containing protein [Vicinamibacteria bacterium]